MLQAHVVREFDQFAYEYGLEPKLVHRPGVEERGEITYIYAVFRTIHDGYGFEVCNKAEMDAFAAKYSKSFATKFSPWQENYEEMAKKTVIERALKYAPVSTEFQRALSTDETIKTEIAVDMAEIQDQTAFEPEAA